MLQCGGGCLFKNSSQEEMDIIFILENCSFEAFLSQKSRSEEIDWSREWMAKLYLAARSLVPVGEAK